MVNEWEPPEEYWCVDTKNNTMFTVDNEAHVALNRGRETGLSWSKVTDIFGGPIELNPQEISSMWLETKQTRHRAGMHQKMRTEDFEEGKAAQDERPDWK